MKTLADLKRELTGKTPYQISQICLSDLIGYRKTSLSRTDDADYLTRVLTAVISLARDGTSLRE